MAADDPDDADDADKTDQTDNRETLREKALAILVFVILMPALLWWMRPKRQNFV